MTVTEPAGVTTRLADLRVGELLAEGGEGRVYEMPRQPHLVYKAYRRPTDRRALEDLVGWPTANRSAPGSEKLILSSSAWPVNVVVGDAGDAVGILMPRAPRRFSLRHRDGTTRLASLSYLTADPAHRAVAYGLDLPPAASAPRIGLVLALARLLAAFETGVPSVGHGDLSTKNVLWSLQRGPEIFVIDCDNCERFGPGGVPLGQADRRRAMTPNWDDPAVSSGDNPSLHTDRYSLALIFLRVVGAANYPVQARQRDGGVMTIDFAVPAPEFADGTLGPDSPLWNLCARGLSVAAPDDRPPASDWVAALETALGEARLPHGVDRPDPASDRDVVIRPVARAVGQEVKWSKVNVAPAPSEAWIRQYTMAVPAQSRAQSAVAQVGSPTVVAGVPQSMPLWPEAKIQLRRALGFWLALHATAARALTSPGRRRSGFRRAGACVLVDAMLLVVGIFLAAMIASPLLGI